jgi:hypothetical protein
MVAVCALPRLSAQTGLKTDGARTLMNMPKMVGLASFFTFESRMGLFTIGKAMVRLRDVVMGLPS